MQNIKDIVEYLNEFDNYTLSNDSDDGRVNSLNSEVGLVSVIITNLSKLSNIKIDSKISNRDEHDIVINLYDSNSNLLLKEGLDIKIVYPSNFTNTISFVKLSKMIGLSGSSYENIIPSYGKMITEGNLSLVSDYSILFFNKQTNKFIHCYLSEMTLSDVTANPSNCIQTKIPTSLVKRNDIEKVEFVHNLWKSYMKKRIIDPAELLKRFL